MRKPQIQPSLASLTESDREQCLARNRELYEKQYGHPPVGAALCY